MSAGLLSAGTSADTRAMGMVVVMVAMAVSQRVHIRKLKAARH